MTLLKNAKYERFATKLADGLSQERAYVEAGFSPNGARGSASSLIKQHAFIIKRRDEILAERERLHSVSTVQAMEALQITKKDVMRELLDNAMRAKAAVPVMKNGVPTGIYNTNISASNQALIALGKEIGMFTDKVEHSKVTELTQKTDEELVVYIKDKYRKLGLDMDIEDIETIEN
jgi:hypothetical protein